jgi:hypothetical protein
MSQELSQQTTDVNACCWTSFQRSLLTGLHTAQQQHWQLQQWAAAQAAMAAVLQKQQLQQRVQQGLLVCCHMLR